MLPLDAKLSRVVPTSHSFALLLLRPSLMQTGSTVGPSDESSEYARIERGFSPLGGQLGCRCGVPKYCRDVLWEACLAMNRLR